LSGKLLRRTETSGSFAEWWNGKRGTGDWFGARPALEDHGINLTGKGIGTFYGVAAGGLDQRGAFDQSLHFDLKVDFAKLKGWSALEGLTAVAGVRYRDGLDVNNFVGASTTFKSPHLSKRQAMAPHVILPHLHDAGTLRREGIPDCVWRMGEPL